MGRPRLRRRGDPAGQCAVCAARRHRDGGQCRQARVLRDRGGAEGLTASANSADERWSALGGVIIGTLIVALDSTIVAIALPQIGKSLHAGKNIQWVVTANLLAVCMS